MASFTDILEKNAAEQLAPALDPATDTAARIQCYKDFLASEHERLLELQEKERLLAESGPSETP